MFLYIDSYIYFIKIILFNFYCFHITITLVVYITDIADKTWNYIINLGSFWYMRVNFLVFRQFLHFLNALNLFFNIKYDTFMSN